MLSRLIHFVMLLSVAYWASGAGHFVHEAMEHGAGEQRLSAELGANDNRICIRAMHEAADDDRDDCLTCKMLAHMSAHQGAPAAVVVCRPASVETLSLPRQQVRATDFSSSIPIRGPPAAAV